VLAGCFGKMSETVQDDSAGMNGSFEVIQSGYPVNWLIYAPTTIPSGSYKLVVDSTDTVDGRYALRFEVESCSPSGGWHSPGFSQEYPALPGETYRVRFWVKNEGSAFRARVGGVSAFEGAFETMVDSQRSIPDWELIEHEFTMPDSYERLRIEVNVLEPGSFWIDGIEITAVSGG